MYSPLQWLVILGAFALYIFQSQEIHDPELKAVHASLAWFMVALFALRTFKK